MGRKPPKHLYFFDTLWSDFFTYFRKPFSDVPNTVSFIFAEHAKQRMRQQEDRCQPPA